MTPTWVRTIVEIHGLQRARKFTRCYTTFAKLTPSYAALTPDLRAPYAGAPFRFCAHRLIQARTSLFTHAPIACDMSPRSDGRTPRPVLAGRSADPCQQSAYQLPDAPPPPELPSPPENPPPELPPELQELPELQLPPPLPTVNPPIIAWPFFLMSSAAFR